MADDRLHWLDELRGVAALSVMIGHGLGDLGWNTSPLIGGMGHGVQLFYMLSGFILFLLYENRLKNSIDRRSFWWKRFFRIAPLYYVVTLSAFLLFFDTVKQPWVSLAAHFSLIGSGLHKDWINGIIGNEWSIFVEFSFYLLFPWLLGLYKKGPVVFLVATLLLSLGQSIVAKFVFSDVVVRAYLYNWPTTQLCFFAMGMFVADRGAWLNFPKATVSLKTTGIGYGSLLAFILLPLLLDSFMVQLYAAFFLFGVFLWAYPVLPRPAFLSYFLSFIGERSYSVYLLHMPLLALFKNYNVEQYFFVWLLIPVLVVVVSDVTYRLIEKRGVAMGRQILSSARFASLLKKA